MQELKVIKQTRCLLRSLKKSGKMHIITGEATGEADSEDLVSTCYRYLSCVPLALQCSFSLIFLNLTNFHLYSF